MARMTAAERRARDEKIDEANEHKFWNRIERETRLDEAWFFAEGGTRKGHAGRLHTRLCYFLRFFSIPDGASDREAEAHRALLARCEAADPDARLKLRAAIKRTG